MEQTNSVRASLSIGGHFSAFIESRGNMMPGNYAYESARSALYALVKFVAPHRVYIPNYICEAITDALSAAGVEVTKYSIGEDFRIADDLDVKQGDLIIIVNYFGLNNISVESDLAKFSSALVVVDCSQAFFSRTFDCMGTLFSPRKFVPVADGGFVQTKVSLLSEAPDEAASIERYKYLLERVVGEPEMSRDAYLKSEQSLSEISLRRMSSFSKKIVKTIDLEFIKKRRRANFQAFDVLSSINTFKWEMKEQIPLCYPLLIKDGGRLRDRLREHRIFTPKYWPNVIPTNKFERSLLDDLVCLPVDHRYCESDVRYMVSFINGFYGGGLV